MEIPNNTERILKQHYLLTDDNGNSMEAIDDIFHRVAECVSRADVIYDIRSDVDETERKFYEMMANLDFLPGSATLMNAGKNNGQLASSFVIPVEDSIDSIFSAIRQCALINKSGAGMGFSFSKIRPEGSKVGTAGETASGPLGFMKVFDAALGSVRNNTSDRFGSAGVLRIDHPDILKFIECKNDDSEFSNFNLYVGITEKFMITAENGMEYNLIDPNTGEAVLSVNAREVMDKIVDAIWNTGQPGIIFLDRINSDNVVPGQGNIEAMNSWGEQPLLPYESCAMGSINLTHMLTEKDGRHVIDISKLEDTIVLAVHFLDNVIDVNCYPLDAIEEQTKLTRKIGLGIMGWADTLLKMRVPYNSDEAVALGERLMSMISEIGKDASAELAETRGAFPLFEESTLPQDVKLRNAAITTIACGDPIAEIAGCSEGIEPIESYVAIIAGDDGEDIITVHPALVEELKARNLYGEAVLRKIADNGSLRGIDEIPAEMKRLFISAKDLSPDYHILMQAAFQKDTDSAVSKAINLRKDETKENVRTILNLAFRTGCKVIRVCKPETNNAGRDLDSEYFDMPENIETPEVIEDAPSTELTTQNVVSSVSLKPGNGDLYISVNYDGNGVCNISTSIKTHENE